MTEEAYIRTVEDNGATVFICGGILDLTNTSELDKGLKVAALDAEAITVDLTGAIFIDTAVIQYLATAAVKMKNRGKPLRVLVAEGSYPQKVIRTVGFDQIMDVVATPVG